MHEKMNNKKMKASIRRNYCSPSQIGIEQIEKPVPKGAVTLVDADNLDELINLLHNEAKVI